MDKQTATKADQRTVPDPLVPSIVNYLALIEK